MSPFLAAAITEPEHFVLEASDKECRALAERFGVEKVYWLKADLIVYPGDIVKIKGKVSALTRRQCVISLKNFDEEMQEAFEVLYADDPSLDTDEIIDPIVQGRIHLGDMISEQYGLALNPFPKKPGIKNPYEEEKREKTHPFANLKEILKK